MKYLTVLLVAILTVCILGAKPVGLTSVEYDELVDLLQSDELNAKMRGAAHARSIDNSEEIIPLLVDSALKNICKPDYRFFDYNSGGDVVYYGIVISSIKYHLDHSMESNVRGEPIAAYGAFIKLYELAHEYRKTYPVSFDTHQVFRELEEGIKDPKKYIDRVRKDNLQRMVEAGEVLLSEGGAQGRTKSMGLLPEDVRIHNKQVMERNLKASHNPLEPGIVEPTGYITQLEATVEKSDNVAAAEPFEAPKEESSKWWPWLISAVVVVGAILIPFVRRIS